jgi:hypothetical protein
MRRLGLVLLVAVGLSGCGVLDDEGPATPKPLDPSVYGAPTAVPGQQPEVAVPRLVPPSRAVAKALDRGAIGVVDLGGVVQIEPKALDTASDIRLVGLRWKAWDRGGAKGEGTLRMPNCQPTCATGGVDELPARVELSGVKTCDGRRYFDHGEVRLDAHEPPATYVRAHC